MTDSFFQIPGDPAVTEYVIVVGKIGGLLLIYTLLLLIVRYYIYADTVPANALRRAAGLAAGVPFASCMTRILGSHFPIPDLHAETVVFLVFVAITAWITAVLNPPPSAKGVPHDHSNLQAP